MSATTTGLHHNSQYTVLDDARPLVLFCVSHFVQRVKKALLLSYNVESGKAKVTEEDRREIRCKLR